mmetsp:Transcript_102983/g.315061  ORF Transcript_102983/g.315061 Transcript_102983/m.315061 type:complete len:225 (+) Transcript_102983:173-847(+)
MTPATIGPVWSPILTTMLALALCRRISLATRTSRSTSGPWPCVLSLSTSMSSGTTPTAHTYSSARVSILVTPRFSQIRSHASNVRFKNINSSVACLDLALNSKSAMIMKRMDTRSMRSSMGLSGFNNICLAMCGGTMRFNRLNNLRLSWFCRCSVKNFFFSDLSKWYLRVVATIWHTDKITTDQSISLAWKNGCCMDSNAAKGRNTQKMYIQFKDIIHQRGTNK